MEDAWNANTTKVFEPSWVIMLDESMQERISKCTCPARMCVGHKPYPFGNERHSIACGLSDIMWFADIVERRYRPFDQGRPEFDEIGKTVGTMLQCTRPIWKFSKVIILDLVLCVTKGLVEFLKKGVFGVAIINNLRYLPASIKDEEINAQFALKEVGNVDALKQVEDGLAYHVCCTKEPDYVMNLMTTYGTLDPTDKRTRRKFKRGGITEKRSSWI